jgi:hypothetical protein
LRSTGRLWREPSLWRIKGKLSDYCSCYWIKHAPDMPPA